MTFRGPIYTRTYPPDTQDRFWDNSSLPLPFNPPANQQGFNQYNWPNPTPPNRIDATWISSVLPRPIPPPNKPNAKFDWTVPVQPNRLDQTQVYNWIILHNPIQAPFNQVNWPNPVQPSRLDVTWAETGNNLPPFSIAALPFNQYDWQLPGQFNRLDYTWIVSDNNILPQPTVIQTPFNQYSWPNPTSPNRPDYTFSWNLGNYTENLYPVGLDMVTPIDWPNPVYPNRIDQTWIFTGLALLSAGPIQFPKNQYSWPNPAQLPSVTVFWVGQIPPSAPLVPNNQYYWPLPAQPNRLDQTWTQGISGPARGVPVGVFSTSSWKWNFRDDVGSVSTLSPSLTFVQPPFNQTDWPVPKGYPRPDASWSLFNSNLQHPTITVLPFNQYNWPNPVIPKPIDGSWINQVPELTPVPPVVVIITGGRSSRWQEGAKFISEAKTSFATPEAAIKKAAAVISKLGGQARAESLTSKQRSTIASKAASIRWGKK